MCVVFLHFSLFESPAGIFFFPCNVSGAFLFFFSFFLFNLQRFSNNIKTRPPRHKSQIVLAVSFWIVSQQKEAVPEGKRKEGKKERIGTAIHRQNFLPFGKRGNCGEVCVCVGGPLYANAQHILMRLSGPWPKISVAERDVS